MRTGFLVLSILLIVSGCGGRKTKESSQQPQEYVWQNNDTNLLHMKRILSAQLEKGVCGLFDDSYDIDTYNFTQEDLDAIVPYMDSILKRNGSIKSPLFGASLSTCAVIYKNATILR